MSPDLNEEQIPLFDIGGGESPPPSAAPSKQSQDPAKKASKKKRSRPASKSSGKKQTSPPKSRSGQVPEGDVRLTANIREDLHLRLKIAAAKNRTTIGDIIEALVEKHLSKI
jgi:hypothetical protein